MPNDQTHSGGNGWDEYRRLVMKFIEDSEQRDAEILKKLAVLEQAEAFRSGKTYALGTVISLVVGFLYHKIFH